VAALGVIERVNPVISVYEVDDEEKVAEVVVLTTCNTFPPPAGAA